VLAEILSSTGENTVALDFREVNLRHIDHHLALLEDVKRGARVVVALPAFDRSPMSASMARLCDAVLLVIALGETPLAMAEEATAAIGRDKLIGAVLATRPRTPSPVVQLAPTQSHRTTLRMGRVT
jgi:hypothetical protein